MMSCNSYLAVNALLTKTSQAVGVTRGFWRFAGPYSRFLDRRARPADIYGPNGALDGWGMTFKHPGELWEVLARNMGGGMPPEVPKTLVNLCGPRVESLPAKKVLKDVKR